MAGFMRDTAAGQIVRFFTGNRVLLYPEEEPDFQLPASYRDANGRTPPNPSIESPLTSEVSTEVESNPHTSDGGTPSPTPVLGNGPDGLVEISLTYAGLGNMEAVMKPERKLSGSTRNEDRAETREKVVAISPKRTKDGLILVDWYSPDDPENPQNWTVRKKVFVTALICIYTLSVYMGSAIYTPSIPYVEKEFGVSTAAASLGLAVYVLGYGTGPMLFSPLSEVPAIGRNPPYIITFAIFVVLAIATALVGNFGGFLALRFLQGFFGSPCLATGGASFQDIYSLLKLPYALTFWVASASFGPALGPVISGFSVPAMNNWRWSMWEILWISGPIFIVLLLFLPETSSDTILHRRAVRLRALTAKTGNNNLTLKSQSEIKQSQTTVTSILISALWRPFEITLLDPAILFTNLYTSLVYGIYYSFFEVFPLVYMEIYTFTPGHMGLVFLSIIIGNIVAIIFYTIYLHKCFEPEIKVSGIQFPERRLIPALFASVIAPAGLFLFGWTSRGNVHWIASAAGVAIYNAGVFLVLQCIFLYIPLIYPQYAASLFAGNDLFRSALAAGAVVFARPLFLNLGVGEGVSLLAGLTVGCIAGVFGLFYFGKWLRGKSRFAVG
ncbi:hypothetical protein AJ79_09572 [Helicocarpus griseus UAMH5409]|uniref:Major facilitator superfamily (MFS) profile domain-containing protein n=1 Tax=Helicocarpus griseus UAMH5409 TaxID=1447875 RepID=A0A2B7WIM4_9EURO|nr:hypothetical protein AJ79_09572 [Helicocarpus griseus UAMH5409]